MGFLLWTQAYRCEMDTTYDTCVIKIFFRENTIKTENDMFQ